MMLSTVIKRMLSSGDLSPESRKRHHALPEPIVTLPGLQPTSAAGLAATLSSAPAKAAPTVVGSAPTPTQWAMEEDLLIMQLVKRHGKQWTKIAARLPGRSDNSVRNRYNRMQRGDEVRRELGHEHGYRCKLCGQPKRGHICPARTVGEPLAPRAPADNAGRVLAPADNASGTCIMAEAEGEVEPARKLERLSSRTRYREAPEALLQELQLGLALQDLEESLLPMRMSTRSLPLSRGSSEQELGPKPPLLPTGSLLEEAMAYVTLSSPDSSEATADPADESL